MSGQDLAPACADGGPAYGRILVLVMRPPSLPDDRCRTTHWPRITRRHLEMRLVSDGSTRTEAKQTVKSKKATRKKPAAKKPFPIPPLIINSPCQEPSTYDCSVRENLSCPRGNVWVPFRDEWRQTQTITQIQGVPEEIVGVRGSPISQDRGPSDRWCLCESGRAAVVRKIGSSSSKNSIKCPGKEDYGGSSRRAGSMIFAHPVQPAPDSATTFAYPRLRFAWANHLT